MNLQASARRTIRRYTLIARGDRVLVALSGGPDSVALLHVLSELATSEGFTLAGAAHLNHQLRGAEADRDEAFCRTAAGERGLPIDIERIDVAALAAQTGVSIEAAAHAARYAFFDRAAVRLQATVVALAHTRDDQAETFLLRLLRGAGPRGLSGMHPRTGKIVRPFIESSRAQVKALLESQGLSFRDDETNQDVTIARNRVRHELIPYLQTRFSPAIVEVLDREAVIAREDAEFLDQAAQRAAARLIVAADESRDLARVEIGLADLLAESPAIARRVIRDAQQRVAGGRFIGFDAVDAVLAFAVSNSTGSLDLPGHQVNRRGGTLVLMRTRSRDDKNLAAFAYELAVPGQVRIPEASCEITAAAEVVPSGEAVSERWPLASRSDQAVVEASRLTGPLVVRNRRAGDRFQPLGLMGHKKLQDFFVDAKVDRRERDTTPLVVDASGQIVWVAGHAVGEAFRVTDRTRAVVILRRAAI